MAAPPYIQDPAMMAAMGWHGGAPGVWSAHPCHGYYPQPYAQDMSQMMPHMQHQLAPQMLGPGHVPQVGGYYSVAPQSYAGARQVQAVSAPAQRAKGGRGAGATAAGAALQPPPRALSGWTVIWVGERAFRAAPALKEQIESYGFLVKVYRSHEKCARALDKKQTISPTSVFLVSLPEAEPTLTYLQGRGAAEMQLVVDAEGSNRPDDHEEMASLSCPEDICSITITHSWEEVQTTLQRLSADARLQQPQAAQAAEDGSVAGYQAVAAAGVAAIPDDEATVAFGSTQQVLAGGAPEASSGMLPGGPWTLVWISDQAFKPAATSLKTRLESLGCAVKGYKTHKNAIRALDKKRALLRTVVLVSGAEAASFIAYLSSRPEIASTRVVVEATARSGVPVRETPTCHVAEDFEQAVAAVQTIAAENSFT